MSRQQIVEDGSRHAAGRGAARGLERRPIAVVLALAGILGPILFTAVFVIQELFRRGEYSPMAESVSALEAGPGGWVQQVMRPTRAGVVGPAILVWSLATYALATGIALLVMFVAFGVLVGPDDAPLHPWAGLAQRVVLAVWFSCTIVLALRLLRGIRAADPQR